MKKVNVNIKKGEYPKTALAEVDIKVFVPNGYFFLENDFIDFLEHCIECGIYAYSHRDDVDFL